MNPFNIREAGQTKNAADAAKLIGVSIPSTSGKPVRQENMKVQMNKFKSQSLQHQGSRSDARYCAIGNYDQSQSLQHQGSRSDISWQDRAQLMVSIPSTSGKPVRPHVYDCPFMKDGSQSLQHQGSRSDTIYLGAESLRSQSLQHQGSRSDACWARAAGRRRSQSLQHQGSRSDAATSLSRRRSRVSIPSTSGKPVRPHDPGQDPGLLSQSLQHQGSRSDSALEIVQC